MSIGSKHKRIGGDKPSRTEPVTEAEAPPVAKVAGATVAYSIS